ncbi:MAG: 5'(3')-deoxyribonucleotidase [Eudoraea sp.]|nr:5'(3')-deoxyribonucleotidase [Eudoraea sp.]
MTLFVDMDEVMADTYGAHIELYNKDYNSNLSVEDCLGREVWQCVPEAHQENIRQHARQPGFFRELDPIKDSKEILRELTEKYDVYIASAAMQFPNSLREKSDWLDEHFPFIPWQNRILCGNKHVLKGDILIDDRSYNLESFKGKSFLFTSPHNIHSNTFERVDHWQQVAEKLL